MTPDGRAIEVLVVDDHALLRRGIVALLGQDARFAPPREAADLGEALRAVSQSTPDLILLDNHMPGVRGIDGIASLREAAPGVRVLMLTVSEDEADLVAALKAGADGYLLKTIDSEDLCASMVRVLDGESVVSDRMTSKLVTAVRAGHAAPEPATDAAGTLSARERQILSAIARGASNKHIARELDIAETTVKIHVQHILRKLGLSSRVQAAVYAASHGLH